MRRPICHVQFGCQQPLRTLDPRIEAAVKDTAHQQSSLDRIRGSSSQNHLFDLLYGRVPRGGSWRIRQRGFTEVKAVVVEHHPEGEFESLLKAFIEFDRSRIGIMRRFFDHLFDEMNRGLIVQLWLAPRICRRRLTRSWM